MCLYIKKQEVAIYYSINDAHLKWTELIKIEVIGMLRYEKMSFP